MATVVLSRGMDLHLQIATEDYPDQRSIRVHVDQAREAVEVYNELAEATPVGRLFHSTC